MRDDQIKLVELALRMFADLLLLFKQQHESSHVGMLLCFQLEFIDHAIGSVNLPNASEHRETASTTTYAQDPLHVLRDIHRE